jgi:hypothetical protein
MVGERVHRRALRTASGHISVTNGAAATPSPAITDGSDPATSVALDYPTDAQVTSNDHILIADTTGRIWQLTLKSGKAVKHPQLCVDTLGDAPGEGC